MTMRLRFRSNRTKLYFSNLSLAFASGKFLSFFSSCFILNQNLGEVFENGMSRVRDRVSKVLLN